MRWRATLAIATASVVLLGCSHGPDPTQAPTGLDKRLASSLGDGRAAVGSATGPMPLRLAAAATSVPEGLMHAFLTSHGFQGGYSRVWNGGGVLVTALGFHFFADRDADAFVSYSADTVLTSRFATTASDPQLPGSRALSLVSTIRGATRFCSTEYFSVDRDAFVITKCADYPVPPSEVAALAQRQLLHALTGTG